MSDARGFMVAAYLITLLTVVVYGGYLILRARSVERRLEAARKEAARRDPARNEATSPTGSSATGTPRSHGVGAPHV